LNTKELSDSLDYKDADNYNLSLFLTTKKLNIQKLIINMKIPDRRLCRLGTGRGFYIPEKYLTDDHIGEHFDLIITPTSIRSRILNLMSDHEPWNIQDLTTEVSAVNQDYDEVKDFVESILETVPEIAKAGDARYRLSEH
jgi:hypothetical protein